MRRLLLVLAAVWLLVGSNRYLLASIESLPDSFPRGFTRDEIRTALGDPIAIGSAEVNQQSAEQWIYETPSGRVPVVFPNNQAEIVLWTPRPEPLAKESDPDSAFQHAARLNAEGNYYESVRALQQCLALNARYRKCKDFLNLVSPKYESKLIRQLQTDPDPVLRKVCVQELLRFHPDSAQFKAQLESVNGEVLEKEKNALLALFDARRAIAFAASAATPADFERAKTWLDKYERFQPAVEAVDRLRGSVSIYLQMECAQANSLEALRTTLDRARGMSTILGTRSDEVRDRVRYSAIEVAMRHTPRITDATQTRALEEILRSRIGDSDRRPWPWDQAGVPSALYAVQRTTKPWNVCIEQGLSFLPEVNLGVGRITFVDTNQPLRIEVSLDCSVETRTGATQPQNSTYIASYQQIANPDYVRAQTQLQQAQAALAQVKFDNAQHPPANPWIAAAQGLAEGLAQTNVNNAYNKVQGTPPYLSQAVTLPYVAEKYSVTRSARLSISVDVSDDVTHFTDSAYVSAVADSTDYGMRNVLPNDAQGLRARDASPNNAADLLRQADEKTSDELRNSIRDLLARAFVSRARHDRNDALRFAGDLLYVEDCSPSAAASVGASNVLRQLYEATGENVAALKLDATLVKLPVETESRPVTVSVGGSTSRPLSKSTSEPHHTAIQNALASVVTVTTNEGLGSGFCVGNGFVVTNAHVVSGAAKVVIHTQDGSRYLGTVIKTLENPDLALLKISANIGALTLGHSESFDVGTDVFAIGSAKGLEGTVTKGIISAARTIDGVDYFQIDAAINRGNSGGPLLATNGEVIGVNTFKLVHDSAELLGFAITSNEVRKAFADFLK